MERSVSAAVRPVMHSSDFYEYLFLMPYHFPMLCRNPLALLYGFLKAVGYHIKAGAASCTVKQIVPSVSFILANCEVLYFLVVALDCSKFPSIGKLYYICMV